MSARTIVLNTSCVRGTGRAAIQALARRGFVMRVNGIAIAAFAVRMSGAARDEHECESDASKSGS